MPFPQRGSGGDTFLSYPHPGFIFLTMDMPLAVLFIILYINYITFYILFCKWIPMTLIEDFQTITSPNGDNTEEQLKAEYEEARVALKIYVYVV